MSQLGTGVMINWLGGNKDSVEAFKASVGKKITALQCDEDALLLTFADNTVLKIVDEGQSCCESRYMSCDDNLKKFVGAKLMSAEIAEAPSLTVEYGDHDVQFLHVKTSKGVFTVQTHVEHNGYYGGFSVRCHVVNT